MCDMRISNIDLAVKFASGTEKCFGKNSRFYLGKNLLGKIDYFLLFTEKYFISKKTETPLEILFSRRENENYRLSLSTENISLTPDSNVLE